MCSSLHYGTTRTVLLIGDYAIKFPALTSWRLFLYGLLGNMQEARFSRSDCPDLCPVVFHVPGGFCTVMRRAEKITREQFFALDVEQWREREHVTIPVENKLDSFGILDGKIVAIDYGS